MADRQAKGGSKDYTTNYRGVVLLVIEGRFRGGDSGISVVGWAWEISSVLPGHDIGVRRGGQLGRHSSIVSRQGTLQRPQSFKRIRSNVGVALFI